MQTTIWGRGSRGEALGSASSVGGEGTWIRWRRADGGDSIARRVATPFSGSSRQELTMSHGRAREAASDGQVQVG
jgi:hypothetical protein